MHITLLCVGKLKKHFWREAAAEYEKHLRLFHKLRIIEVADEKDPSDTSPAAIQRHLEKEGTRLEKHLDQGDVKIALAVEGKAMGSESFANHLKEVESRGKGHLVFIIGGSYGLSEGILARCDTLISFSKMTFPHQLMRVIFLEQLFRAAKINAGHTYHK